jgi:Flp pilus assembly protein TadG
MRNAFRLLADRRGTILPLVAAGAGMLFAVGATTIDLGHAYSQQNLLQTAADTAALAAVREIDSPTRTSEIARQIVQTYFPGDEFGNVLASDGISIGVWNAGSRTLTSTTETPNALRVTVRRTVANGNAVPLTFARVFGWDTIDLEAEAVATRATVQPACLIALDPSMEKALLLSGGSGIDTPDCGIQVNANHYKAMEVSGGGHVEASEICVVGNAVLSGGSTTSPVITPNCPAKPDPFARVSAPAYGGCDHVDARIGGGTVTFSPGVYCGGIEMTGGVDATFLPGRYVIRNGPLKSGGGGSITGDGVVFQFTGTDAYANVSGGGDIHLTAPPSGALAGFVFFQDDTAEAGLKNKLSGGGTMYYEGAVYFPDQHVEWSGGSVGTAPPWTMFVARSLLISGGGAFQMRADFDASSVPVPGGVASGSSRLVQ